MIFQEHVVHVPHGLKKC